MVQCTDIVKTCHHGHRENHFERSCQNKFRSNTGHGESLSCFTASSFISCSEVSDNLKVLVEKKDTKGPLVQKTDNDDFINQ